MIRPLIIVALTAIILGCGFHLRGSATVPFHTVYIPNAKGGIALEQDEIELVVQVNGKLRGSIKVPKAADPAAIEELARANPNVQRFVAGQNVKKVVVVPGRLVNLVV